jgi:hypothetical protein
MFCLLNMEDGRSHNRKNKVVAAMITTPEDAKRQVQALGLPRVFVDLWNDKIPFALQANWQKPKRYFTYQPELLKLYPRLANCVPLWESNRDHVFAFDLAKGEYVVCYYDEVPRFEVVADCYQRFAAAYLVECVYSGLKRIEEISVLLEFKYVERIRDFAEVQDVGQDPDELKREFVASIPAGR